MGHRTHQRAWLRPINDVRRPVARVVCFPHSGGSVAGFAPWVAAMPPEVALLGVQYPGRGDRFGEPMVSSVMQMSAHVVAQLLELLDVPSVLFGHSLGALVAYESAMVLRDRGREPRQLCVSGSAAPRLAGGGSTHLGTDEEFWATVCGLGGMDPEIARNEELRELMLPVLRSDIRASDTYHPVPERRPLSCAVRCYHGAGDQLVDPERLDVWAEVTTGPLTMCVRPGGHFHTDVDPAGLAEDVVSSVLEML